MWWRVLSGLSRRRRASARSSSCAKRFRDEFVDPELRRDGGFDGGRFGRGEQRERSSAMALPEGAGEESGLSVEAGGGGVIPNQVVGLRDLRREIELGGNDLFGDVRRRAGAVCRSRARWVAGEHATTTTRSNCACASVS